MPDFTISFTTIKQITTELPTSKVEISFRVLGSKSGIDIVQVYALNAVNLPGGLGQLVDTVDMQITEVDYSTQVDLQSGALYTLYLCPRGVTNGVLDDEVEGEYWESFCISQPFTTKAPPPPPPPPPPLPDPEPVKNLVAMALPFRKIRITWENTKGYNHLLITRFHEPHDGVGEFLADITDRTISKFDDSSSNLQPLETYRYQVETQYVQGERIKGASAVSNDVTFPSTFSLREFLPDGVDPSQGIKPHTADPNESFSVRDIMEAKFH